MLHLHHHNSPAILSTKLILNYIILIGMFLHQNVPSIPNLSIFSLCISGAFSLKPITDLNLFLIVQKLVGEVTTGEKQGYVRMVIEAVKDCGVLFGGKNIGDKLFVLMSHGDEAVKLTDGFEGGIVDADNKGEDLADFKDDTQAYWLPCKKGPGFYFGEALRLDVFMFHGSRKVVAERYSTDLILN
ncbi:hypothetical protein L2E82_16220 [Cichorium intybus]|uniref:Uncharacterized protein n=1 Tax=Cichorium intybus TaxID=13427 RepID=A0ACB9F4L7_CICIN|nr:hypothetical protein L2E82_16220 [Cichorium intybus]